MPTDAAGDLSSDPQRSAADSAARLHLVIETLTDADAIAAGARRLASRAGLSPGDAERIAIAVRELATNIVCHAGRGSVDVTLAPTALTVSACDEGPGFAAPASPDRARPYRGLGVGLEAVTRMMDDLRIESLTPHGARVTATKWLPHA